MTIELRVTWGNAGSNLPSNADNDDLVSVTQAGSAVAEDKGQRKAGIRVFQLADSGDVTVTFDLKVATTSSPVTALKVVQKFSCTAGAVALTTYDTEKVTGISGRHPLVALPSARQKTGAATLFITTDFIDVTGPWFDAIIPKGTAERTVWDASDHFNTRLFVLACLNGFPPLWFASVPKACGSSDHASALVFYRPSGYKSGVSIERSLLAA
jgi:hypothetical protein